MSVRRTSGQGWNRVWRLRSRRLLSLPPLILVLGILTGCGGGGGSNSNSTNDGLALSVSPLQATVSATTAQSAPVAYIQASVNVPPGRVVNLVVHYSENGIASTSISNNLFSDTQATLSIGFKPPASLGAGIYQDTLQVAGCYDQACTQQVADSPQTVQVQYTVTAAVPPTLTTLNPSSITAGGPTFTLTASGTNFTSQSVLMWNGSALPTTFVSPSQLTAQVDATDIATASTVPISVDDPVNGDSGSLSFVVQSGLTSISPTSAIAQGPPFTLTATGTGFTSRSQLMWNGTALPTTLVSATELTAQVSAADIATAGSFPVVVNDPESGPSNTVSFTVQPATLSLMSIYPSVVTAGDPAFSLTVTGSTFTNTSVVQWNGSTLPTTYVSSYQLVAQVSAAEVAAAATASITVHDPASAVGTTTAQSLTISASSVDATGFQMNPAHTGAVGFPAMSLPGGPSWSEDLGGTPAYVLIVGGEVFATVSTANGSQLIALDGATGKTIWGPVSIAGNANAAYDNGRVFVISSPSGGTVTIEAFDAGTGASDWNSPLTANVMYGPTAANGIVFVLDSFGYLYALDESTGATVWKQSGFWSGTSSAPAVTASGAYVTGACETYDFTPSTGVFVWQNSTGCTGAGGGTPVVANQLVYSPVEPNQIAIVDAATGAGDGTYSADQPPAITATMGYFLYEGTLQGISVPDDTVKWSFKGDGTLTGSPIVVNQDVFIGSSSGNLYALDAGTGNELWTQSYGGTAVAGTISSFPQTGLAAGDGLLVVPVGTKLYAYIL